MGDLTWGMDLNQARADFAWIARIPGRKIILKGKDVYKRQGVSSAAPDHFVPGVTRA